MAEISRGQEETSEISPKKRKFADEQVEKREPAKSTTIAPKLFFNSDFLTAFESVQSRNDQVRFETIRRKDLHLDYCEKFLPKSVADLLLQFCERNIRYPEKTQIQVYGKWHSIPRKQIAYGDHGLLYGFSGAKVAAEKWPKEIEFLKSYVSEVVGVDFNFVLVNRYADGKDHIGEHKDDEKELDPQSCIASLSIGQCRDFVFRHEARVRKVQTTKNEKNTIPDNLTLQLKHGSILLMHSPTNKHWYHSLPIRKNALGVRINFTFRKVVKI